jgi:DNA-directed RNA polymerase subunit RPC12/RpoP
MDIMSIRSKPLQDIRLICARCGACAGHPEDRDGAHCRHCGARETIVQERNKRGEWVTPDVVGLSKA